MTKRKTDLERFAAWLAERGGEVLVCTNNWELVRFRGDGVTSIIYNSKSERWTFTGRAQEAWEAFQSNDPAFRITAKTVHTARSIGRRKSVITQTILLRDGDACFYCGEPLFGGEGDPSLVDDIAKFLNPDQKTAETAHQQQRAS